MKIDDTPFMAREQVYLRHS